MSNGSRITLAQAAANARRFRDHFSPGDHYSKWEFAGSIRRKVDAVGDIEHLIMPWFKVVEQQDPNAGLFVNEAPPSRMPSNQMWARLDALVTEGNITRAIMGDGKERWGPLYRAVVFEGIKHDIFLAEPRNWGAQLVIRTGPWQFGRDFMMDLQRRGYTQRGGFLYDARGVLVPVPDEEAYFQCAGRVWLEPEERN